MQARARKDMDDLAGLVVEQLRVEDGPGSFVLLYTDHNRKRVLLTMARRTNGVVHYQHAYADVTKQNYQVTYEGKDRVAWDFVTYTDVDAAAYFAKAFMIQYGQVETAKCEMSLHRFANLEDIMENTLDGTILIPEKHTKQFYWGWGAFSEKIGTSTHPDLCSLRAGLLSLMPTSPVGH